MSLHRSFVHARLWVALALALASSGALAKAKAEAGMDKCQTDCASEPSQQLQVCINSCPGARNRGKNQHFEACAQRCKAKFETVYKACCRKCPNYQEPKKAKDSEHHDKDRDKKKRKTS